MKKVNTQTWLSLSCILILVVVTGWTFLSVHNYGYVDYDDPAYITGNPYVNSGVDIQNIRWAFTYYEGKGAPIRDGIENLYHPVTWISHMIDIELFGIQSPGAQHIVNLLIHIGAGVLLFFIFLRLTTNHFIAFTIAVLFCVHPLHVESVAWLSERKDTLSAFFAFTTILFYQLHVSSRKGRDKWLSVICFILALLSKPSVVILPGILMLLDQYQQHKMNKLDWEFIKIQLVSKMAWIVPSIGVALVTIYFQQSGLQGYFMQDISFLGRLSLIPTKLCYYLYHTFYPAELSFHYASPPYSARLLSICCFAFLSVLTVVSYRLRRQYPLVIFGLLWFYLCILPMSGIVHVGTSFIADRYTYLAIIGIFVSIAGIVVKGLHKPYAIGIITLIILCCAWVAKQQTKVWKNSYALFSNAVKVQPRDSIGFINLGVRHKLDGDLSKAGSLYIKALELHPGDHSAHHNLAHIYIEQEEWGKAESGFLKALEIYEYYQPSLKSLSTLYRTVPDMRDLEKSLDFTQRYNQVVRERDANMLVLEIKMLANFKRISEAKAKAIKLQKLPKLSDEIKKFVNMIMNIPE